MPESTYHHGNLREALIEAGHKLLETKGFHGMTLRATAREANVSPTAPYRHFKDAKALAAAIAEQSFNQLRKKLIESIKDTDTNTVPESINRLGQAYVAFALNRPEHHKLMFSGFFTDPGEHPSLEDTGKSAFGVLVESIEEAKANGYARDTETEVIAITAWAFIHGLSVLLIENQIKPSEMGFNSNQELVAQCQEILRNGWAK